jgi:Leucine-rich repeat (LRR) protein
MMSGEALPAVGLVASVDIVQFKQERAPSFLWAERPELQRVSRFRLYDEQLGDEGAMAFARSPYLQNVTELMLSTDIKERGVVALASSPNLARVTALDLQRNQLDEAALRALVGSPYLRGLRALHLGRNALDLDAVGALSRHSFSLTRLDLDRTSLTGEALSTLCASGALRGVTELNLSNNAIGAEGCRALASCEGLSSLEVLFLHSCQLRDEDVEILLRGPHWKHLRNLALSQNQLTQKSVGSLAECEGLSGLMELDVCHNPFSPEEAERQLRASMHLERVGRLCV